MQKSRDGILTSHVGALPRPKILPGRETKQYTVGENQLASAVADIVEKQAKAGIHILGDGEFGKSNFLYYVRHRYKGFAERPLKPGERYPTDAGGRRDLALFPSYFDERGGLYPLNNPFLFCAEKIAFVGHEGIRSDIRNLKQAMAAVGADQGFLTAVSPCTVALTMPNEFYDSEEEYNVALTDALHEEYRSITDAGLILQIDEPGLPGLWQQQPDMTIPDYRRHFMKWVELLNYALRDSPASQVRLHCCWGSYKGPHIGDVGLESFVDLLYAINATCYSVEGANPRHDHEWALFNAFPLPIDRTLMPGLSPIHRTLWSTRNWWHSVYCGMLK